MQRYDESLEENPFFKRLLKLFPTLYEDAPHHNWLICVPRVGTADASKCSDDDFQCHVLQPLNQHVFCTLNAKQVRVTGKQIVQVEEDDLGEERPNLPPKTMIKVDILFEEVFYNSNGDKFRVLCTEGPLQGERCESVIKSLLSVSDCVAFLKQQIGDAHLLNEVEALIKNLERNWIFYNDFHSLKKDLSSFYTQALSIVLQNANVASKCKADQSYKDNICLALESYSVYVCREKVMRNVVNLCAARDAQLNRVIRRLWDVEAQHLDIDQQLTVSSGKCKVELGKLICYSTPLTKKLCLKRAFDKIQAESPRSLMSTDELLPFFIFLVLKTPLYNWHAQLTFMKEIGFSLSDGSDIWESDFYLATLEAALEHISSGGVSQLQDTNPEVMDEGLVVEPGSCEPSVVDWEHAKTLFKLTRSSSVGELESFRASLSSRGLDPASSSSLCHPLCACERCSSHLLTNLCLADLALFFRDAAHSRTALQVAVALGRDDVAHFLLRHCACVNARDAEGLSALHIACQRGRQKTLLLLLDEGADVGLADGEGNTGLHLASSHGHINCVQTLVYCSEHLERPLDVDARNGAGDAPLHLAARLGFLDVVRLLLEFGADVKARNKLKLTPGDVAHSDYVKRLLDSVNSLKGSHAVRPKPVAAPDEPSPAASTPRSPGSEKRLRRLHRAIAHGDVREVCCCLGVSFSSAQTLNECAQDEPEVEEREAEVDASSSMCHPLCQCDRCQRLFIQHTPKSPSLTSSSLSLLNRKCVEEGVSALHVGVRGGEEGLVRLLLSWGAEVNADGGPGAETALHLAVRANDVKMAQVLLEGGASLEAEDATGSTPVDACLSLPSGAAMMSILLQGASAHR